jgi:hypothetical protein
MTKSTKELPLFSDNAKCGKCGKTDIVVRWVKPRQLTVGDPKEFDWDNDRLNAECCYCRYHWQVRPLDQATERESWAPIPRYKLERNVKGLQAQGACVCDGVNRGHDPDCPRREPLPGPPMKDDEELERLKKEAQNLHQEGAQNINVLPRLLLLLFARLEKAP